MNTSQSDFPIYIGSDAINKFVDFIQQNNLQRFFLVCDENTYQALGRQVQARLGELGKDTQLICLKGTEIIADESTLIQVMLQSGEEERVFLAVGSGTITDITRYVSFVTRLPFISLPTAPSVDGYTSMNAPLVVRRIKETIKAHGPMAVFADLDILCQAPPLMIAAGFGDMLGKLTALADWQLSRLVMGEFYDNEIARRAGKALQSCIEHVDEIGSAECTGVRLLMEGLIETGLCMLKIGMSHPASGAEHHISHFWEMKLLQENRPALLHGAKVGVATAIVAGYYQDLRQIKPDQLSTKLAKSQLKDHKSEIAQIRSAFGSMADELIEVQRPYLSLTPSQFAEIKTRISDHWQEIQSAAATVPSKAEVKRLLTRVHGPSEPADLGLSQDDIHKALANAHNLRSHFTILTLYHLLGW